MVEGELGTVFRDGEIIYRQGDPANCLYLIQAGKVLIYQDRDGQESAVAELGKGDTFGDMGVFLGPVRTESARSLGGARVITADSRFVLKKFRDDPSYAFQIIEKMARRDQLRKEQQDKALETRLLREVELKEVELREAGLAAEAAHDRTADFYDFAPVGAIDLDGDGIIRAINLAGAAMLGAKRQELLALPFTTFVPQASQPLFREHLQACRRSSEGVITELLLNTRNGGPAKVQIFSYPKQDPDRVVYRTLMTELAIREAAGGPPAGEVSPAPP